MKVYIVDIDGTICNDGSKSSERINKEKNAPTNAPTNANKRYKVPISLWFVEKNQRRIKPISWSDIGYFI